MSKTPCPPPTYDAVGNRYFRHQILGYPVGTEWLEQKSMEFFGHTNNTMQVASLLKACPGFERRMLRLVYQPKTNNLLHCVPVADNVNLTCMRRVVPEDEIERMREHTCSTGEPLWYDVAG